MASKTFSAACLLVLMVAGNTFLVSNACNCPHNTPSPPPPTPSPSPPPPTPSPSPPPPTPSPPPPAATPPTPSPPPPSYPSCPKDKLKLAVCADVLGLVDVGVGNPPSGGAAACCSILGGLGDVEAALCLCKAITANVFGGVITDIPVVLNLILNYCGKTAPAAFQCF